MEHQSLDQEPSLSTAEQIELYARELMSQGVLLTWVYSSEDNLVTLYIPTDIEDESILPESIAGVTTVFAFLPRPVPFSKEDFREQLNEMMSRHKIGVQALALALKDSIDPGIFTIENWQSGKVTPSPEKFALILQTLDNIAQQ